MERREQIKYIKTLESDFLNKVEGLVQTKYLNFLFDKYKKSVQEISECYKNPNTNLSESAQCAKITMEKYFDKEKRFETLLHHYENSISECLRLCRFDIKNPIVMKNVSQE